MNPHFLLLPSPRQLVFHKGSYRLEQNRVIQICASHNDQIIASAKELKNAIFDHDKKNWSITLGQSIPAERIAARLEIDTESLKHPQGYHLTIGENGIEVIGVDEPGLYYGIQTLKQILSQRSGERLPYLDIIDWPDFQDRGVMLDISRDKVYRMDTLFMLIDELASWKINQIQLYTEHTFAYYGHETVWQDASPLTPENIIELDRYCRQRFIKLIPNQNSFGHMTRWLKHPQYQHLAETTDPIQTPWGHVMEEPFSLSPVLPETITFLSELYDQLLPNFSSRMFNVGCDETFDVGKGKSKAAVQAQGMDQIYLDFLLSLHWEVTRRGFTMQFWGDMILEHPERLSDLPNNIILLDWGYEQDHPFSDETMAIKQAGINFYVCPGTSSWNSIAGRTDNMLANIENAIKAGLGNGAIGVLNTDWGDNGHWQQLPISYPGLVTGAAQAWCYTKNKDNHLAEILNLIVFRDANQVMGDLLINLGNEYKAWGLTIPNSSPLFWLLQDSAENLERYDLEDQKPIHNTLERLADYRAMLDKSQLSRPDSALIYQEIDLTIRMMEHACRRGLTIFGRGNYNHPQQRLRELSSIKADFKRIWMERNRIGGLTESLDRFNIISQEYKEANA